MALSQYNLKIITNLTVEYIANMSYHRLKIRLEVQNMTTKSQYAWLKYTVDKQDDILIRLYLYKENVMVWKAFSDIKKQNFPYVFFFLIYIANGVCVCVCVCACACTVIRWAFLEHFSSIFFFYFDDRSKQST